MVGSMEEFAQESVDQCPDLLLEFPTQNLMYMELVHIVLVLHYHYLR